MQNCHWVKAEGRREEVFSAFISVSVPQRIAALPSFNDAFRKARVTYGNSSTSNGVGSADGFPH